MSWLPRTQDPAMDVKNPGPRLWTTISLKNLPGNQIIHSTFRNHKIMYATIFSQKRATAINYIPYKWAAMQTIPVAITIAKQAVYNPFTFSFKPFRKSE
jgi:hypothetical protein